MKNMIDRYVYDVTRRLPEDQREEVQNELLANIDDMLGKNPSEQEIEQVLLSLGHPRKLANSYTGKQRYLIGPEWMDDYLMVLKIVVIVLGVIGFVSSLLGTLLNPEATTILGIVAETFAKTISGTITAMINGFALVTIIFVIIEHFNKNREQEFLVSRLPDLPVKKSNEIKRGSTITSLVMNTIFGVLFIYLLATDNFRVIWIDSSMDINISLPILTASVVEVFLPLFVFSFTVAIAVEVFKLFRNKWDYQVFAVHAIGKVITTVVSIAFLTTPNLINFSLVSEISQFFAVSQPLIDQGIHIGLIVLAVLTGIGAAADILTTWFKKVNR